MSLATVLEQQLAAHGDPARAAQMSAYMKDKFSFCGVPSQPRKELFKSFLSAHPEILNNPGNTIEFVTDCWQCESREIHYCAVELLSRKHKILKPEDRELIEYMITTHSWWDSVDGLASNVIGPWMSRQPNKIAGIVDDWLESDNLWLQRCCLLFQLKYRMQTDTTLLEFVINRLSSHPDFFIRKAIGWILRQYAKSNPEYVRAFVHQHKLSPLSEREALKHL